MNEAYIEDNRLLCDCPDFTAIPSRRAKRNRPHHCQHTDALRRSRTLRVEQIGAYYFLLSPREQVEPRFCGRHLGRLHDIITAMEVTPIHERYAMGSQLELAKFRAEGAMHSGKCEAQRDTYTALRAKLHALIEETLRHLDQ